MSIETNVTQYSIPMIFFSFNYSSFTLPLEHFCDVADVFNSVHGYKKKLKKNRKKNLKRTEKKRKITNVSFDETTKLCGIEK
jgi:hypothetical protein